MLPQCLYYYSLHFSMLLIDSLSFFSKKQYNLLTTFTVSHCFNFFLLNFLQMLRDFFKKKIKIWQSIHPLGQSPWTLSLSLISFWYAKWGFLIWSFQKMRTENETGKLFLWPNNCDNFHLVYWKLIIHFG